MKEMIRMCRMFYKESRYHEKTMEVMASDFNVSEEVMTHFVEVGRIMEDAEYSLYLKKEGMTRDLCTKGDDK